MMLVSRHSRKQMKKTGSVSVSSHDAHIMLISWLDGRLIIPGRAKTLAAMLTVKIVR